MTTLPLWLLDKVAGYAGGQRLPKRKKFVPPAPKYDNSRYCPSYYSGGYGKYYSVRQEERRQSPVSNDLYRFWMVEVYRDGDETAVTCECRSCGHVVFGEEECKAHITETQCAKLLVAAYKVLLREHRCVICDVYTREEKWGVPLCRGTCTTAWMESEARPQQLYDALQGGLT